MTRRWWAVALAAMTATALWSVGAQARWGRDDDEAESVRSSVRIPTEEAQIARLATVTIEEAARAARGAAPGTVIAAELEDKDGSLVWSVDVSTETGLVEVLVDPGNGSILSSRADDEEDEDEEEERNEHRCWRGRGR